MSWHVSAIGRAEAVAHKIVTAAAAQKCGEPEQTIKESTVFAVHGALMAFPPGFPVKVEMYGSQGESCDEGKAANCLSVKIEPLYGFVE